jgi:hypothetical protein
LIALLAVTSSTAFANYPPNLSSFIAVGASLAVVIACAIVLYSEANTGRATAKHDLVNATLSAEATGPITLAASEALSKTAQQLELLLRHVDQMSEGAFGPFSQQPLVRAVLLLMGGFGWTVLIENGIFPGL